MEKPVEEPAAVWDPDDPKNWPDLREYLCGKPSPEVWEGFKEYLDQQIFLEGLCGMDITENFRVKRLKKLTEFYEEY